MRSAQACGISIPNRQRCLLQAEAPNVLWRPPTCLQGAVKQWNSICGSDLRRAIFSKKVGQGLQRCWRRNEQPPLSPGGLLPSASHTASVEVKKADLTSPHDCSCNHHCRTVGRGHTLRLRHRGSGIGLPGVSAPIFFTRRLESLETSATWQEAHALYSCSVPATIPGLVFIISFNPCSASAR